MRLRHSLAGLGVLWAAGCGSDPAAERLLINIDTGGGPVQVDTACGTTCGGSDQIAVTIRYPNKQYRDDDIVELLQYRIDYNLAFVKEGMPYFAGTVNVALAPGDSASMVLTVAGTAQRKYVAKEVGSDPVGGTATLKFAGYDWDDGQFTTESEFDLRFADLANDSGTAPPVADEPTDTNVEEVVDGGADASF